jgi:hypothetical protein
MRESLRAVRMTRLDANILFAGPTLADLDNAARAEQSGFEIRAPAVRGDIDAVVRAHSRGTLVLADGRFHQCMSVGHAELRRAVAAGWNVWGLSSMGALRAFEMRDVGVRGYGVVYEHLLFEDDFQDDEVALLHSPVPPYQAATEPLIHLRYLALGLEMQGQLAASAARCVIDALKSEWYGNRTLGRFLALVSSHGGPSSASAARAMLQTSTAFKVKACDLEAFLRLRVWEMAAYVPTPRPMPYH